MGFSFKKLTKAIGKAAVTVSPVHYIPGVKQIERAVDVTSKTSAVRAGLRATDKAVGGGQGWGKITQAAGVVVGAVPGFQGVGAGIAVAGKGLQVQAAKEDAARAQKKATAAALAAGGGAGAAMQTNAGNAAGVSKPSPLAAFGAWLRRLLG